MGIGSRGRVSTILAVATLAVGIGSSVALFSLLDAVLLRPLPYAAPERLVALWDARPETGINRSRVSGFNYQRWVERARSFEALALVGSTSGAVLGSGEPFEVEGLRVTCNVFNVLGVRAVAGRGLIGADCDPGAPRVMVLTHALWMSRFGGDASVIGRGVTFDGVPTTIVGVLPPILLPSDLLGEGSFVFNDRSQRAYVPLTPIPSHHGHVFGVLGRLHDGTAPSAARADLNRLGGELRQSFPDSQAGAAIRLFSLEDEITGSARRPLGALMAAALLLLAIACSNVAQLQLTRVLDREPSSAVRAALGASRLQIARPFVVDGLILAACGGALGTVAAVGGLRWAVASLPPGLPRIVSAAIDGRALAVALGLTLVAGGSMGWLAGWRATQRSLVESLHRGPRVLGGRGASGLRGVLLGTQAALAVVLVANAALMATTLVRLSQVDAGFDAGQVLIVELRHAQDRYRERKDLVGFYQRLESEGAGLAGVESVGASYDPPLRSNWYQSFAVVGVPETTAGMEPGALFRTVTPGYFDAAGVSIVAGRGFTDADDVGAPGAVIVNDSLARRFLPGGSPLGRQMSLTTTQWMWGEAIPRLFTVVGVAENERIAGLDTEAAPAFYLPFRQTPQHQMSLLVRTRGDAAALLPELTRLVRSIDPLQPVAESITIHEVVASALSRQRLNAWLASSFALCALGLAALGVAAVLGESIARRRPELAVRLALGSSPRRLFAFSVARGVRPVLFGALPGIFAALACGRLVAAQLYGVRFWEPTIHVAAATAVIVLAGLACLAPARRAARTDPAESLRSA